ncbi:MAG: LVIVD repeat-containing protein [bacterium]
MKRHRYNLIMAMIITTILTFSCGEQGDGDNNQPEFVGKIDLSMYGRVEDVFVFGDYAYIAGKEGGLIIVDITSPDNPVYKSKFTTDAPLWRVFIKDNYLYGACSSGGLVIIDVSDPDNITKVGEDKTGGSWAYGVYINGKYAYWTGASANAGKGVFCITDVTDPTTPFNVSCLELGDAWGYGIYVSDNIAYIGDRAGKLYMYDITNPNLPVLLGMFDDSGEGSCMFNIKVENKIAHICNNLRGFIIVDVNNPSNTKFLGRYDINYGFYDLILDGQLSYTSCSWGGLLIIDISEKNNMKETRNPYNPEYVCIHGIDKNENYIYLADSGTDSLIILDISK